MTIPNDIIFPDPSDRLRDGKSQKDYLNELVRDLQDAYGTLARALNGYIRTNTGFQQEKWEPILKGTSTAGTFTYDHQVGYVFRQGLLIDCWFDVKWTAKGTAAGNLYIELPYEVANVSQKPFVGTLQISNLTLGSGTYGVLNAITNTYRGEVWNCGNGAATANQAVLTSGQLMGHIRYVGKQRS